MTSGCAGDPVAPSPLIMCPAPVTVVSATGAPILVTYPAPVASGGIGLSSTCTPPSGSSFAVGSTAVSCSATVSEQRASCSFNVTVASPPRIDATKFMAFGDSITYGSTGACFKPFGSAPWTLADDVRNLWENATSPGTSYPSMLEFALQERYAAQNPVVVNLGFPGEYVADSTTLARFRRALTDYAPEVLLLQEGINDLHVFDLFGIAHDKGISNVVSALRGMSLEARARGIRVFLGTLLPERPNGCRANAIPPRATEDLITPTNNQIRAMAAAENIDLVDLYAMFDGHVDVLLDEDGLHPALAGYATMSKVFLSAVQQKLENPPPGAVVPRRPD